MAIYLQHLRYSYVKIRTFSAKQVLVYIFSIILIKRAKEIHKPNFVTGSGFPKIRLTIIHLWMQVALHLLRPTREFGRAALKHSSIWSCTAWGLQSFSGHPENWCALTAPFHPYRNNYSGGILSVALSFTLP